MRLSFLLVACVSSAAAACATTEHVPGAPSTDTSQTPPDESSGEGEGNAPPSSSKPPSSPPSSPPTTPPSTPPSNPPASVPPDSCTPMATACAKGGSMSYCISYSAGPTCKSITYKHDAKSASCPCTGGDACTDAYYVAYTDCADANGACDQLDACCDTIDANYEPTCRSSVSSYQGKNYGDVSCKSLLSSWRSSGLCP